MSVTYSRIGPGYGFHNWITKNTEKSTHLIEFGAGFFDKLKYVPLPKEKKIGIEIYKPYIDNAKYTNCIMIEGDIHNYRTLLDNSLFDTCMYCDVLEHFDKEDAINLINMNKIDFNKILLMIPEDEHPQELDVTGYGGHTYQTHRSTWYIEDIINLGFQNIIYDKTFTQPQEGDGIKTGGCIFAIWNKPT